MRNSYFFCGIGGSGMSALAAKAAQGGANVSGSDRARDRGDSPEKFKALEKLGIKLFPQDGSGITGSETLVVSSAVEDSIPDVKAAKAKNVKIIKRAELLSGLFNESKTGIAVAGTSGKSTVTGMIAVMLTELGRDPAVMNGGLIRNFDTPGHKGLANMRIGKSGVFVAECDESDGSIALYNPAIAVLNNISLDHKSLDELDKLFGDFIARAGIAVLNADDEKILSLLKHCHPERSEGSHLKRDPSVAPKEKGLHQDDILVVTYGIENADAAIRATNIELFADGAAFQVTGVPVRLKVPGLHNVQNALAALGVAQAMGIDMKEAAKAIGTFNGIKRRMEITGTRNGITVIDDFAHNPDKIAASLKTLKGFPGRLIVMFQPHGFGPLKMMGKQIAETFAEYFSAGDILLMPEAYYAGGTAERTITAKDVVEMAKSQKVEAQWFEKRADILPFLKKTIKKGDRVVVMGARDDTLSDFAQEILKLI